MILRIACMEPTAENTQSINGRLIPSATPAQSAVYSVGFQLFKIRIL